MAYLAAAPRPSSRRTRASGCGRTRCASWTRRTRATARSLPARRRSPTTCATPAPSTSTPVTRVPRRPRRARTRSTRALVRGPRLLRAHGLGVRVPADGGAQSARSRAAAATTAWPSSIGGAAHAGRRLRLRRRARSCWPSRHAGHRAGAARARRVPGDRRAAARPRLHAAAGRGCARAASRPRPTWPGAASRASCARRARLGRAQSWPSAAPEEWERGVVRLRRRRGARSTASSRSVVRRLGDGRDATATCSAASRAPSDAGRRADPLRLGRPPARPRRPDLHRPARPLRPRAAGDRPRARARGARRRRTGCGSRAWCGPSASSCARAEGTRNPNLPTGDVELRGRRARAARARREPLPFQLDEENVDETLRVHHRYLDLRRPEMQRDPGDPRAASVRIMRRYLEDARLLGPRDADA